MHVNEICTWQLDTASPHEKVLDVARRMNDRNVGALVVVDADNRAVGIVTDRDITVRVTAQGRDAISLPISEVMTPQPETVSEMTTVREALYAMRAGLEFELAVNIFTLNSRDNFFETAMVAWTLVEHLDAPALVFSEAVVHAEQVAGEYRGFVPSGSRTNFQVYV